jgi:tyrosyl-DNA phosphodiesterase 2
MPEPRAATPLAFSRPNRAWLIAPSPQPTPPVDFSLLTWNVWFGGHRFGERRAALIAALAARQPDVILLQEVTPELLGALVAEEWVQSGYHVSDATGRTLGDYGILVLSRLPIVRLAFLELPTTMGRALVMADLACGMCVATVHLESMRHSTELRVAQLGLVQSALAEVPDVVLAGDFNFSPEDPDETAALDPALVDLWPALYPADPGYTIDSSINTMRGQTKSKAAHERIDRVFLRGPTWRARSIDLVGAQPIDAAGTFVSDHFGLSVELEAIRRR